MNRKKHAITPYVFTMLALGVLILTVTSAAFADDSNSTADSDSVGPRSGISFGGRGMFYHPKDAENGSWSGGAQLRLHFTSVIAVEGSADYRQNNFAGTTVDVYPVQASLLLYLLPGLPISPYLLGGVGWYFTHLRSPYDSTQNRFGPHAGAGLEVFLNHNWSLDGSYRYIWNSKINEPTSASPFGKDFSDSGSMVTAALNYYF